MQVFKNCLCEVKKIMKIRFKIQLLFSIYCTKLFEKVMTFYDFLLDIKIILSKFKIKQLFSGNI